MFFIPIYLNFNLIQFVLFYFVKRKRQWSVQGHWTPVSMMHLSILQINEYILYLMNRLIIPLSLNNVIVFLSEVRDQLCWNPDEWSLIQYCHVHCHVSIQKYLTPECRNWPESSYLRSIWNLLFTFEQEIRQNSLFMFFFWTCTR